MGKNSDLNNSSDNASEVPGKNGGKKHRFSHRRRMTLLQKTAVGVLAAAAVCVIISFMPVYRNYIRQSNIDTCYGAMYSFGIWYHLQAQDEINSGTAPENVNYPAIAKDVVKRHFGVDLDDNLSSGQICRAGGEWTIFIDPDTHKVIIQCTSDGHIWYVDSVDEQMMEEFQDMVY